MKSASERKLEFEDSQAGRRGGGCMRQVSAWWSNSRIHDGAARGTLRTVSKATRDYKRVTTAPYPNLAPSRPGTDTMAAVLMQHAETCTHMYTSIMYWWSTTKFRAAETTDSQRERGGLTERGRLAEEPSAEAGNGGRGAPYPKFIRQLRGQAASFPVLLLPSPPPAQRPSASTRTGHPVKPHRPPLYIIPPYDL